MKNKEIAAQENQPIDYGNTRYLLKRLFRENVSMHSKTFLFIIFLMVIIALTTAGHAYLIKPALDKVFIEQNVDWLFWIPIAVFIITIVKAFTTYFQLFTLEVVMMKITASLRQTMYGHFIKSDISKLHNKSSGDMSASILMEIGRMVALIGTIMNGAIKQSLTLIFLIGVMFQQSLELSLIAFIGFPLAVYPIYKIGRKLRHLSYKNQEVSSKFVTHMQETLQYSKLVKSYNCEDFEINRMSKIIDNIIAIGKKISRFSLMSSPFTESLAGVGVALVISYGGHQVLAGNTTPGAFFSFFAAMMMAYRPLKSVSGMNAAIQLGLASATRFYKLIDEKQEIVDKENALDLQDVKGSIKFEDVSFSYVDDKTTLKHVNIEVEAGTTVALVGHSGGGKSTTMSMMLRFYDPETGRILLDGHDIRDLTLKSVRRAMSVVNQEVMLFDDTILENLRYGKEDATETEIINAAKMAEADEFIRELPEGYETQIGQNGIRLSGGQRQRIAIARAILYNAPILLLDEATSSLDPASERLIKNALAKLMKGRTSVVIAHRLSTVMHADKIFVISDGEIVESGNHKTLLAKDGAYANLYSKQFEPDEA